MNKYREDKPCCDFHPKEVIVGVCPLCLNEKLLILAAKQGNLSQDEDIYRTKHKKSHLTLPKIFAFGSLRNRFHIHHKVQFDNSHSGASASPEDSFISIKFEDNGVGSWEKSRVSNSKVSLDHCNNISWNHSLISKETKRANKSVVVEHAKPRGSQRWRKPIGHLFQVSRWKRSSKGSMCHVGNKLEGVEVRSGWIRTLTKRRTN